MALKNHAMVGFKNVEMEGAGSAYDGVAEG